MASILSLLALSSTTLAAPFIAPSVLKTSLMGRDSTCSNPVQSCTNTTAVPDSCCFQGAGLISQVQFWDTDPSEGPSNSWTIHGLWPDYCDGSYGENCDSSRAYSGSQIQSLLQQNAPNTLTYMETYWISNDESASDFWAHEWGTHGTCYNTIDPSCYADYAYTGEEAVDFFNVVVGLFQNLTTYDFLNAAGITPSDSATYSLSDLNAAVKSGWGKNVEAQFSCQSGAIDSIAYYFNTVGNLVNGTLVPVAPVGDSSCPNDGISYPPKSGGSSSGSKKSRRSRTRD